MQQRKNIIQISGIKGMIAVSKSRINTTPSSARPAYSVGVLVTTVAPEIWLLEACEPYFVVLLTRNSIKSSPSSMRILQIHLSKLSTDVRENMPLPSLTKITLARF